MKYNFIEAEKGNYPVNAMCRVLSVAESGFYRWQGRRGLQDNRIPDDEPALRAAIEQTHRRSRGSYGRPRLIRALREQGWRVGGNRVRRIMLELGLRGRSGPRRSRSINSDANHRAAPNLLDRNFTVGAPNLVWGGDLTELRFGEQRLWLAAVVDLCARMVVGWALRYSASTALATEAMRRAVQERRPPRGLIFHSDRGVQYRSHRFQAQLDILGIRQSMSRRGNCWDNAPVESFFATLKKELIYTRSWQSKRELEEHLGDYIHFYNRERLHSTLAYCTPAQHEEKLAAA